MKSSRIKGLHNKSIEERRLLSLGDLDPEELGILNTGGLSNSKADTITENVIGIFALPLSVVPNFLINDEEYILPMVTEEPSIVAAASNAAKLCRDTGGFKVKPEASVTSCELLVSENITIVKEYIKSSVEFLKENLICENTDLVQSGGKVTDIHYMDLPNSSDIKYLKIRLDIITVDAMGANIVNSAGEKLGNILTANCDTTVHGAIVTNSFPQRTTSVSVNYSKKILENIFPGSVENFLRIYEWAKIDPSRAVTHNKGIINGISGVAMALGNDTRAIESGLHFRAASNGIYQPLSRWSVSGDFLHGEADFPLAVATVGGMTSHHPEVSLLKTKLRINNSETANMMAASAGLANNFSALFAIATSGIQHGHMKLHKRKFR
ncbi:MAG: 3-hydroxy-3-methylglutaryl-CoA reductase [Deltaproteobacteria bacterium]|nr:3-hydroxy-3-methylglutaryl-CoA reductase [Deltaproteobacteria bacterium]